MANLNIKDGDGSIKCAKASGAGTDEDPAIVHHNIDTVANVVHVDDNGATLTVDGTITANLSDTDNAVLDTIDAVLDTIKLDTASVVTSVQLIDNAIAGNEMQVDVLTMPTVTVTGPLTDTQLRATAVPVSLASVPSHAVTGPLTDTQLRATAVPVSIASVPSHNVTNAGTFATQATLAAETTKVIGTVNIAASQTIAVTNATAANLKAELGASSAAIGKLAANSGVDIGDVDVLSIAAGTNTIGAVRDAGPSWTSSYLCTTSADASGTIDVTAAPTTGQKIVIDDIILSIGATAQTVTFEEETSGTDIMVLYMPSN